MICYHKCGVGVDESLANERLGIKELSLNLVYTKDKQVVIEPIFESQIRTEAEFIGDEDGENLVGLILIEKDSGIEAYCEVEPWSKEREPRT